MTYFNTIYRKQCIAEWWDYYINYLYLEKILLKLRNFKEKTTVILLEELISNITKSELVYINNLKIKFERSLIEETEKFNKFFKFVYKNSIRIKFFKILLNIRINETKSFSNELKNTNKSKLREAIKRYYKEIIMLRKFV